MTKDDTRPPRDWWDKAGIISGFLSSVVIAVVGIYITYSIQQAQIASSTAQAKAQLTLAKFKAEADKKLQEGQLTATLIEHLACEDANRREIAVLALRETTPINIYDNVMVILAKNDPDQKVRQTAISQLGNSSDPEVLSTLASISREESRSVAERDLAIQSLNKATFTPLPSSKMTILASASPGEVPSDVSAFTTTIVRGLLGSADTLSDGIITADELVNYVHDRAKNERQTPWFITSGYDPIVLDSAAPVKLKALIIAMSQYKNEDFYPLLAVEEDAKILEEGLMNIGAKVTMLSNPTSEEFHSHLDFLCQSLKEDEVFILYYSGHGVVRSNGMSYWPMYDAEGINKGYLNYIRVKSVMHMLENVKASVLLLVDTCTGSDIYESIR